MEFHPNRSRYLTLGFSWRLSVDGNPRKQLFAFFRPSLQRSEVSEAFNDFWAGKEWSVAFAYFCGTLAPSKNSHKEELIGKLEECGKESCHVMYNLPISDKRKNLLEKVCAFPINQNIWFLCDNKEGIEWNNFLDWTSLFSDTLEKCANRWADQSGNAPRKVMYFPVAEGSEDYIVTKFLKWKARRISEYCSDKTLSQLQPLSLNIIATQCPYMPSCLFVAQASSCKK